MGVVGLFISAQVGAQTWFGIGEPMTPQDKKLFETMKQLIKSTPRNSWGGQDYQFGQIIESRAWYQELWKAATKEIEGWQ